MKDRIVISPSGIRVSKPGYDANTASDENMALYSGMDAMRPTLSGSAVFTGGGSQDFTLPVPLNDLPFVVLRGSDDRSANRRSYCAELWLENGAYRRVRIRNIDGRGRTVTFFVLRSN